MAGEKIDPSEMQFESLARRRQALETKMRAHDQMLEELKSTWLESYQSQLAHSQIAARSPPQRTNWHQRFNLDEWMKRLTFEPERNEYTGRIITGPYDLCCNEWLRTRLDRQIDSDDGHPYPFIDVPDPTFNSASRLVRDRLMFGDAGCLYLFLTDDGKVESWQECY